MTESVINVNQGIMGGTPVFRGTRVPIRTLFDYMSSDDDVREFFDNFPTVSREHVVRLIDELEEMKERVLVRA
uniref:Uncharacterized conserved protein, DUF433 family n=1 Tax=Candidatus Kentrum sp. FW TaxID=2126338 RepID=A0A450TXH9_9GAMM|nr:MAG: Uncharacterized conserved protein, DUF433 family [Candidatus Kentron sp. FW]